jgi:hypothetical protein
VDQRPPPEVTIHDPARPAAPLDVLGAGDDEPPAQLLTRLRVTAAGAVLVLLAGLAAAGDLRDEQRAAAEQQGLASMVDLRLDPESSATAAYDRQTDTAVLELLLRVHNDGPHDVVILSGGAGGYGLARPVELRAGSRGLLLLEQTLDCSTLPASPAPMDTLALSVRTAAGLEPRRVAVPMTDAWAQEQGPHACRAVPLHRAVTLDLLDVGALPDGLRLTIEVTSVAREPVAVVSVRTLDPGLEATAPELAQGPLPLPSDLLGPVTIRVDIRITDCAAARTSAGSANPFSLEVLVEDDRHAHPLPQLHLDPALRAALVGRSC